jgi:Fe-S oxidoreductase
MKALSPYKEAVDVLKEAGGENLELCYQCGLCTGSCPWNLVRSFLVRRLMHESQLGLVDFESEDVWLCATCNMCVSVCPRGVEITDVMRALRRTVVGLGAGAVPESLRLALNSMASAGNPWGEPREQRADWAKTLNVKPFAEGTEILYFPCCLVEYDTNVRPIGQAMVSIFQGQGIDFGILGADDENCCGESARKVGNEELFQELVSRNTKSFAEKGVKKIVVSSPHCYYTFKNEYPQNGIEVVHSTQFLAELLREGKLKFSKEVNKKVAYHDPCYLGRHSGVYDEPREVLSSIPGLELIELPDNRENSLCCGGGGGRVWMETPAEERFADIRIEQAREVGADVLAAACPYCRLMFETSTATPAGGAVEFKDISELVAEAM